MKKLLGVATILVLLPWVAMDATAPKTPPTPPRKPPRVVKTWVGMVSWYGDHWKGRKMACGQPFDPDKATAAHPYLPCGTWVRVTNLRTKHSQFAQITDRGPYEEGREMDVSERVARHIDLKHFGVERVKIELLRPVDNFPLTNP